MRFANTKYYHSLNFIIGLTIMFLVFAIADKIDEDLLSQETLALLYAGICAISGYAGYAMVTSVLSIRKLNRKVKKFDI